MKFAARNQGGELLLPTLPIENFCKKYPDGTVFTITIEKLKEKKSNDQLGYLHAEILSKLAEGFENAGYRLPLTKQYRDEEIKHFIKTHPEIMFVEKRKNILTGEILEIPRSFRTATKNEMTKIIDWSIQFAAEYFGIVIDQPKRR
jgi:hypothetical protein